MTFDAEQVPEVYIDPRRNRDGAMSLADALTLAMRNSEVVRVVDGGGVGASPFSAYDPPVTQRAPLAAAEPEPEAEPEPLPSLSTIQPWPIAGRPSALVATTA